MVETEAISIESVLRCSRRNKDEILAAILRERIAERLLPCVPFVIEDQNGELVGTFRADPGIWERSKSPPPMTAEERARFEEAVRHPERTFTLEEFWKENYPEDFLPNSK
jgi:hypothetical protein